jgi:GNAT superfamily N-acetyltransferase
MADCRLERVGWDDDRAVALRRLMDAEMRERYGLHDEPAELTAKRGRALSVDPTRVRATLLAVLPDGTPAGHIVLRMLGDDWEVKRLIVTADARRSGIGRALLAEVERIARDGGAQRVILQAGDQQPEAVALYRRLGYSPIPVYEPYVETMPRSLCFQKVFTGSPGVLTRPGPRRRGRTSPGRTTRRPGRP